VIYSVSVADATSYNWIFPTGATNTSTTNIASVDFDGTAISGVVSVEGANICGVSTSTSTLSITVNTLPLPAGVITGSLTVCQGQNGVSYSIPSILNASGYTWTFPTGASSTNPSNTAITNFNSSAQSGVITAAGVNMCGTGPSSSFTVTVNLLPDTASAISGFATVCQGDTGVVYTVNPINNVVSYIWSYPLGAIANENDDSLTVNYAGSTSGNISVYGQNACGNGLASTVFITINPLPLAPVFTGSLAISNCPLPDSLLFTFNAVANATSYNWQLPAGGYTNGSINNDSLYVGFNFANASDTIKVQSENACGKSAWSFMVLNGQQVAVPAICMVSVDSLSTYNYIYWEKSLYPTADSFIVYREVSTGIYLPIGSVSKDSFSLYIDTARSIGPANGDPNIGTYRYKLAIKDSCGNISAKSPYHNSVFFIDLQNNTFIWNTYDVEGQATPVGNFYLMRDDFNTGNYVSIGSVSGTQTTLNDPNYATYQGIANWRVDADNFNCTPTQKQGNNSTQTSI